MQALYLSLSKYGLVTPGLMSQLTEVMVTHTFHRGEIIVRRGSVNRRVYFIVKGAAKITGQSSDEDVIPYILKENDLVIAPDSFFCEAPTVFEITATEDTVAVSALKSELDDIGREFPELLHLIGKIQAKYRTDYELRVVAFQKMTPEEKYEWYEKNEPDLMRRLEDRDIYTFLGMSRRKYYEIKNGRYKGRNGKKQ